MPTTTRVPLLDTALATSAVSTLIVSAGPGQVPTTPSTLTYNASTQTLSVGAVAAVPKINTGTETGTLANPNPQTLLKHQTIDPARGRWDICAYGDFFSNGSSQVWDPGLFIGYNPNRDFTDPGLNSEPSFTYSLEAYYYEASSGKTTAEAYVEFLSPANDGVNRFQRRPWSFTLDRASGATRFGIELGPVVAGFASSFTIAAGPATGGSFSIVNVVAGATAAASVIQLLSPTVSIGSHTLSDVDGGSSGTLIFGNDNQPTRSLKGNNTTLEVGSWFTSLRYKTPAGVVIQSDTIDEIDVFTFNANVLHTNHKIFQIQHVGSTLAYVDIAGLTATNLTSSGTLTVAGGSTFSGLINAANSGSDGSYNEVFRAQIAGNLGVGSWRNSIESSLSSTPSLSGVQIKIATSQTTQEVVAAFKGDLSTSLEGSLLVSGPTTVVGGSLTVSAADGTSVGTLIFGNDSQPTRSLTGNNTTLEVGSWFTSLRYKTPAGVTVQADTIDEIDVFTFNANVLHTNHKIFQIQHVGSTLAYVDIIGLTAANLTSSGTLTVAGSSTFSGLIDTDTSGADGAYNEVFRAQIAGNLGTGNWRNSIESSCSSTAVNSGMRIKIATSQTTQDIVATFKGDLSTTLAGSLSVGGGASLSKILPASAILDFPSIAAGGQQELTISVTGAAAGAMVSLGPPSVLEAGVIVGARVSASGVVTVCAANITGSPIDPASATYKVVVFNP